MENKQTHLTVLLLVVICYCMQSAHAQNSPLLSALVPKILQPKYFLIPIDNQYFLTINLPDGGSHSQTAELLSPGTDAQELVVTGTISLNFPESGLSSSVEYKADKNGNSAKYHIGPEPPRPPVLSISPKALMSASAGGIIGYNYLLLHRGCVHAAVDTFKCISAKNSATTLYITTQWQPIRINVNGIWALPNFVCDFYIAMDVICSTSSIFNLVAISIDRFIAVTQPIKYAKHRNSRRVCLTILVVWAVSAAIGSPIVLGLNNTPNRDPDLCVFYNTNFILYSSISSFYIPCFTMLYLYYNIFKALRNRAQKQRAARKPHLMELTGGSVIENIVQTRRLAETTLDSSRRTSRIIPDEAATNTASGSNEEEEENAISPDADDCQDIVNDKSTEFMLATVVEETGNVVAQITTQPQLVVADPNGNHDSGYAPSNVDDVLAGAADSSPPDSPVPSGILHRSSVSSRRNTAEESPKREPALSVAMKPLAYVRYGVQEAITLTRNDSTVSTTSKTSSRKDKKSSQASSRFTIYKVHKASKKKREKSSAKKERKATKTLAIVLGVFLICWAPFFTCNIMDALCEKSDTDCRPGMTIFVLTTWLGYINSFVNPVIYTIFNPEFRKAFKKIIHMG